MTGGCVVGTVAGKIKLPRELAIHHSCRLGRWCSASALRLIRALNCGWERGRARGKELVRGSSDRKS